MTPLLHKVFAYITNRNKLLVFRHLDFPEAGIQVPAGTVKPNEELAAAVLREAQEETGLTDLTFHAFLGEQIRYMKDVGKDEIHHRYFYHLVYGGTPPNRWRHNETDPGDGGQAPIRFEFFWGILPDQIPGLICDHGIMLPVLEEQMRHDELEIETNLGPGPTAWLLVTSGYIIHSFHGEAQHDPFRA